MDIFIFLGVLLQGNFGPKKQKCSEIKVQDFVTFEKIFKKQKTDDTVGIARVKLLFLKNQCNRDFAPVPAELDFLGENTNFRTFSNKNENVALKQIFDYANYSDKKTKK